MPLVNFSSTLNETQMAEYLAMRRFFRLGSTPLPEFLEWIGERLAIHHKEGGQVDFVQHLQALSLEAGSILKGKL